ncbi:ATP phosphoribosyltransferase regulatory subunit [Azohydromonas caseinilytica]|uniref:ATP phosphoribosyltransferase regulatory subunit n=1 Tax=Azohydromonas caseinilytica TaxID=2728836 RepID=A0A848F6G6_9BURK|nr:ATP phosphoribosyltransferase regulatory subunit [Azohydromonas caseinilytica]NML14286.1 ATP phosphoribosyltransferase regulatory subunit [Azohydromonas caseinilytica]
MSSAWLLPEHIADVLPSEARRIEELRRGLLDMARSYGFELVMPPLLEYLESLLSGTGHALDLQTFKLIDQLSGRTLGVRADTTPQVARIDAHLLNRAGVTRLCYCGPVLHTRPAGPRATREPLQFGAEIYGHAGLEADLEVVELALDGLGAAGVETPVLDLGDARILRALLQGVERGRHEELAAALARKDAAALTALTDGLAEPTARALRQLAQLYGGPEVLEAARAVLPDLPGIRAALDDLAWLARHVQRTHVQVRLGFDLGDVGTHAYYSGARFAIYGAGASDSLVRGGRYDEVGAVFGRNRPAVGFSLDLKALAERTASVPARSAVRAPWGEAQTLREAVRSLRRQGETVLCVLPGHEHEGQEFDCDRELVAVDGQWVLRAL